MEFSRKKHSNRVRYVFGGEEMDYTVKDGSASRSFSVAHSEISRDRQALEERNQWLRKEACSGFALWAGLMFLSLTGDKGLQVSFWLWVGLAGYAGIFNGEAL